MHPVSANCEFAFDLDSIGFFLFFANNVIYAHQVYMLKMKIILFLLIFILRQPEFIIPRNQIILTQTIQNIRFTYNIFVIKQKKRCVTIYAAIEQCFLSDADFKVYFFTIVIKAAVNWFYIGKGET